MWPTPASSTACGVAPVMSWPSAVIVPEVGAPQAGDRVDELGLPVAVDAGDARRSRPPRPRSERPRTASSPRSSCTTRSSHTRRAWAGFAGGLLDAQDDVAADHEPGEARLGRPRGRLGRDVLAPPQDGDPVGDVQHLVELVGDEDDRRSLGREAAQDLRELDRLLGGQHGGGLVEDQDVGAPVERLQDLDALLHADRDVLDERVGSTASPNRSEMSRTRAGPRRGRASTPASLGSMASTMFSATVMTGMSMKCWWTMPMPERDRVARRRRSRPARRRTRISPSSGLVSP